VRPSHRQSSVRDGSESAQRFGSNDHRGAPRSVGPFAARHHRVPDPHRERHSHRHHARPDGNLWFTETGGNKIGRITPTGTIDEFPALFSGLVPWAITAGPDGNLWFTNLGSSCLTGCSPPYDDQIGRITPAGSITYFPSIFGWSNGITSGPDGNLWFAAGVGGNLDPEIVRMTPSGAITEFALPAGDTRHIAAQHVKTGSDGNLWFTKTEQTPAGGWIGRITPTGTITEFPIPTAGASPVRMTAGPDGNIWFVEQGAVAIGRITPTGTITEFPIPTAGAVLAGITAGPDGNLWFTDSGASAIGRITPAGTITEFPILSGGMPGDITTGPDGNLWFVEPYANKIGRFALNSGLIPPDANTGKCEDLAATHLSRLSVCMTKCQVRHADAALKGRSFDVEACEQGTGKPVSCRAAYNNATARLLARTPAICPACLDAAAQSHLADLMVTFIKNNNGEIYCAGTAPLP
jgi:streptogramin lyase